MIEACVNDTCSIGHDPNSSELCSQCLPNYASEGKTITAATTTTTIAITNTNPKYSNITTTTNNNHRICVEGRGELCNECPETIETVLLITMTCFVILAVFVYLVYDNIEGTASLMLSNDGNRNGNDTDSHKRMPFHSIIIRIVSSYLQVAGMLLQFDVPLPPSVKTLLYIEQSSGALSERLLLFHCATTVRDDRDLFALNRS